MFQKKIFIFIINVLLILILINILLTIFKKDKIHYLRAKKKNNIHTDGYQLLNNFVNKTQLNNLRKLLKKRDFKGIKNFVIKNTSYKIKDLLGKDYVFQDYVWMILKSFVHTCHRDNNGSFFNKGQKHESYTIIIYLEDMERCLDVMPKTHKNLKKNSINLSDYTKSVPCKPGDAIIFNANLIHTGSFNKNQDNPRIQMKVSHKDDLKILNYYQNFNKLVDSKSNMPVYLRKLHKNITCTYPFFSDITQNINIKSSRGSSDGAKISFLQKMFSLFFYGNANYYDLKDI